MKILVAEDDSVSRYILEISLKDWGLRAVLAKNGEEAWAALQRESELGLAILDWMMPGLDGLELCRRIRSSPALRSIYVILLTARADSSDVVTGLSAGADDYVTKPFNGQELKARISVGLRMAALQSELAGRIRQLENALSRVKQLQGLLPICSYCKRIRDDRNYWQQVEGYLAGHSDVEFSHSICPDCLGSELSKLGELGKLD
jgi:DNA-binding response OmpR family regulator